MLLYIIIGLECWRSGERLRNLIQIDNLLPLKENLTNLQVTLLFFHFQWDRATWERFQ